MIDAGGLLVLPGVVDAHVHFDDPGREEWEGFDSGSAAAVAGGVTTVVDMPIDCDPPTVTVVAMEAKADAVRQRSRVDVAMWAGLVPGSVRELAAMADAGAAGFKAFVCPSGWDDFPRVDDASLATGCEVATAYDVPVAVHCERPDLASGPGLPRWRRCVGRPSIAAAAGARLHVVHVVGPRRGRRSSALAPRLGRDLPALPGADRRRRRSHRRHRPVRAADPRPRENRAGLWEQLRAGRIDWVVVRPLPLPTRDEARPRPVERREWRAAHAARC